MPGSWRVKTELLQGASRQVSGSDQAPWQKSRCKPVSAYLTIIALLKTGEGRKPGTSGTAPLDAGVLPIRFMDNSCWILLAENDPDDAFLIKRILQQACANFEIVTVNNGTEALRCLR